MGDKIDALKARVDQFKKNRSDRKERKRLDADDSSIENYARLEQERRKSGMKRVLKDVIGGAALGGTLGSFAGSLAPEKSHKTDIRDAAIGGMGLGLAKSVGRGIKNKIISRVSGMGHKTDAELAEIRAQKLRSVADRMRENRGS